MSFLVAIGVGLLVACAFFMISYAKLDAIRSKSDLSLRRSYVERPDTALDILADAGTQAKIVELSGFLFFGTSNDLRDRLQAVMDEGTCLLNGWWSISNMSAAWMSQVCVRQNPLL